tara:strand:- start:831 stop:1406 length:576 start_codon:yes stop_codon:yes gene_type:complete
MFVLKKKYFLIIESIKDIDLSNLKKLKKFIIIYRAGKKTENIAKLLNFRNLCKSKKIKFFISNNEKLMKLLKADGLYISSYNKDLRLKRLKISNYKLIGSAHNMKEINIKLLQGCSNILYSRLFKTNYEQKKGYMGAIKFNLFIIQNKINLVPLGGIRLSNLNKLNMVNCNSLALLSEIKKKPAKIINRLF